MATKLKKLTLNEVSLVDRGANQHAHVTLFKRDGVRDGLAGKIGEATDVLAKSIASILEDAEADKPAALAESFKQYHDHLQTLVPAGVSDAVTAALAAHTTVSKDNDMTDKTAEVAKQLEEANAALAKASKELAFHKLFDAHKAYATETKLEGEALDAFVAKSETDRDAHIKAAPVVKVVDAEVAKRDAEIAELRKRVDAGDEAKVVAEFAKKAVDLGLPEAKGDMLRKAYSGDKTAQAEVETLIKGLREQIKTGKLFDEFGTKQTGDATSPKARVMAKVAEIRKADPTIDTDAKAIAKIAADVSLRDLWNEYKAAPAAA